LPAGEVVDEVAHKDAKGAAILDPNRKLEILGLTGETIDTEMERKRCRGSARPKCFQHEQAAADPSEQSLPSSGGIRLLPNLDTFKTTCVSRIGLGEVYSKK
jgi:hypothetical protein